MTQIFDQQPRLAACLAGFLRFGRAALAMLPFGDGQLWSLNFEPEVCYW
jgi:hypothetical protein